MQILETEKTVQVTFEARRRGLVSQRIALVWVGGHQDPGDHPFNNYSEEQKKQDRDAHRDLSWLEEQIKRREEEPERDRCKDKKDRN